MYLLPEQIREARLDRFRNALGVVDEVWAIRVKAGPQWREMMQRIFISEKAEAEHCVCGLETTFQVCVIKSSTSISNLVSVSL